MRFRLHSSAILLALLSVPACAQAPADYLAGNTVLIVRHAEKPATGSGLTAMGEARAQAYVHYFEPFTDGGLNLHVDDLIAGADSANSVRPRLTLEPLSKATGLPLHDTISTGDPAALVAELRSTAHGHYPLIAWRHGKIPALLLAFGASPDMLLPGGKWSDGVFDDVVVLTFDQAGHLASQRLVHESLQVPLAK